MIFLWIFKERYLDFCILFHVGITNIEYLIKYDVIKGNLFDYNFYILGNVVSLVMIPSALSHLKNFCLNLFL